MESNYFKGLTRRDYIQKVQEIIKRDGDSNISIRKIAKELGCSSAALYRYFESKEELVYYLNLKVLESYIARLNEAQKNWKNPWDIYVGVWDCYCKEAFAHPDEFNILFFKHNNAMLNQAIREYYEMFPDNIQHTNRFFWEMLNTSDFLGRDFEMCKKCVEAGVITYENAVRLNRMVCMIYKGYFKTVYDERPEEATLDVLRKQCIRDIERIVKMLGSDLKGYETYYEN
ncbi:MAG: TetR/AcrR family transcriptional regulator [Dorea sp.]